MKYLLALFIVIYIQAYSFAIKIDETPIFEILDKNISDFKFLNGTRKIAIAKSYAIEFWDMDHKEKLFELPNSNESQNYCIDISSDNKFLAVGTKNGDVVLWDVELKEIIWEINITGLITDIKISPDNLYIVAGNSNSNIYKIKLFNGDINNILEKHALDVTALEFVENGSFLISASGDKSIIIWDFEKGVSINQLKKHKSWVRDITINSENSKMISCGDDRHLIFWNIADLIKARPIWEEKAGLSWVSSINYYYDMSSYVYSNIFGKIVFVSTYAKSTAYFKSTVLKVDFNPSEKTDIEMAVLIKDYGLQIINLKRFKTKY